MRRRAYLIFDDIEGKLHLLHVECTKCARKGRPQGHREIRAQGKRDEMEGTAQGRLHEARCTWSARTVRFVMSRPAEDPVATRRRRSRKLAAGVVVAARAARRSRTRAGADAKAKRPVATEILKRVIEL
jgi:hypothetical protein